jgi:hypothetical protein
MFGTIAAAVIAESLDSAVRKAADILDVSGAAPLASIPVIANMGDQAKTRRNWVIGGVAILASILLILGIIHFAYRPLDVLWFQIGRKLGL